MKKNKKIILLTMLVLIVLTLIYTSYGFFSTKIFGNDTSKTTTFKNNPLSITYNDNTNIISGDATESFTPGSTITKTFSVSNPGTTAFSFGIILDDIINTFTRTQDITYTVTLDGNEIINDIFPTSKKTIIYNQNIEPNETLNYVLTINYLNSEENQIEDSGAEIGAKLVFDYGNGFDNILIYGNSIQGELPDGYTQLEYIECTGTQFINTNYIIKTLPKIEADVMITSEQDKDIIGTPFAQEGCFIIDYTRGGQSIYYRYGTSAPLYDNNMPSLYNVWTHCEWGQNVYYNGNLVLTVSSPGNFSSNNETLYIGRGRYFGDSGYGQAKFGRVKIFDNNILVRDLIPAKNSSNVIGMYDTVNNVFYTNAGTGEFIAGLTAPTPSSPVEIQSVGDKTINLFSGENVTTGKALAWATGLVTSSSSAGNDLITPYLSIDNLSYLNSNYSFAIFFYDANKNYLGNSQDVRQTTGTYYGGTRGAISISSAISSNPNIKYYRVWYISSMNNDINFNNINNIMLYDSNTLIDNYEPYGKYKIPVTINNITTNIYLDEPLRKIGDYADYIDFKNQKVVRNVKQITLDDSLTYNSSNSSTYILFRGKLVLADKKIFNSTDSGNRALMSENFPINGKCISAQTNTEDSLSSYHDDNAIYLSFADLLRENTTNEQFSAYISLHPINLHYVLKTPTEESITVPNLSIYPNSSNVSIGTSIEPSNVEININ